MTDYQQAALFGDPETSMSLNKRMLRSLAISSAGLRSGNRTNAPNAWLDPAAVTELPAGTTATVLQRMEVGEHIYQVTLRVIRPDGQTATTAINVDSSVYWDVVKRGGRRAVDVNRGRPYNEDDE